VTDFAWPWCFLALPLPWLLRRFLPSAESGLALRVPRLPAAGTGAAAGPKLSLGLAALAWLLLVTAAARPQGPAEGGPLPASGRHLMLAFDVSASMGTRDLGLGGKPVERLLAARRVADDFLRRREGDRVGLIVFGRQAYLHTPLTFDLEAVREALAGVETGLAGRETALGDAVALAVKHLRGLPDQDRTLVLLTDGANTAGTLSPQRAAWLARREGIRIHVVGLGAPGGDAGLDEKALRDLADQTGGIYGRAVDAAAMADFWRRLEDMAPRPLGSVDSAPRREFYPWPLGLALALAAGLAWRRSREAGA
jgi:Ca-activated chloride channel family protein